MKEQAQYPGQPTIRFRAPTVQEAHQKSTAGQTEEAERIRQPPTTSDIYYGSYSRSFRSRHGSRAASTPAGSAPPSPRASVSQQRLEDLLENADVYQETYGLEELRDGFFDGFFSARGPSEVEDLRQLLRPTHDESGGVWLAVLGQYHEFKAVVHKVCHTRAGIKLLKSLLAVYIAYIVCLITPATDWLGRYSYIMVVSTIINHPGRTVGAQIDGFVLTSLGGAAGVAWGSLALYTSTSTDLAKAGYGGVLAAFLVPFTALCAFLRCTWARFYQATLSGGIAICYICLADTSTDVGWHKVFDFILPWILGQALALLICTTIFPDVGSRPFAVALNNALNTLCQGLQLPRSDDRETRQKLAFNITSLSDAVRDLTIDISVTRFHPGDAPTLRNLLQGVIRAVLVVKPETRLFDLAELHTTVSVANIDQAQPESVAIMISRSLSEPTHALINALLASLQACNATLMDLSGYRRYLGPPTTTSADITSMSSVLAGAIDAFDRADAALLRNPRLPKAYSDHPEVVQLLLFVHPIRLVADKVSVLLIKVGEMKDRRYGMFLPSYPAEKALCRNNAQVRHDRGGLTAAVYFRTKRQLERTMNELQSRSYVPVSRRPSDQIGAKSSLGKHIGPGESHLHNSPKVWLWKTLHDLQGFETRFALKVVIATTSLSIPAWLQQSRGWWNEYDAWWTVVMVWLMMHPRVGGNFQDLLTRVLAVLAGAIWAGFANAATQGNPYVVAAFALVFMAPMLFRFTQSSHPRSGLAGCLTFTVVSLSARRDDSMVRGIFQDTWVKGCAFAVGVIAAVIINWIIWPFIARHELRKSLSSMTMHLSVLYRGVIGRYIYYLETQAPTSEDVERSEMLEGRLREAFIRIRQLLDLTRHEIRLRAPFNPKPYERLIESYEDFFEDLIQIRQSSLYFQPKMHQVSGPDGQIINQALLSYRRDTVAAILMDLYILSGALKTNRPVPRYTPSAAIARKRLLDKMAELEGEWEDENKLGLQRTMTQGRRWANVYQYAFNAALTDIVEQLEDLQLIAKVILGEKGFDQSVEQTDQQY